MTLDELHPSHQFLSLDGIHGSRVTGHGSRVTGHGSRVTGHGSRAISARGTGIDRATALQRVPSICEPQCPWLTPTPNPNPPMRAPPHRSSGSPSTTFTCGYPMSLASCSGLCRSPCSSSTPPHPSPAVTEPLAPATGSSTPPHPSPAVTETLAPAPGTLPCTRQRATPKGRKRAREQEPRLGVCVRDEGGGRAPGLQKPNLTPCGCRFWPFRAWSEASAGRGFACSQRGRGGRACPRVTHVWATCLRARAGLGSGDALNPKP
jgi:hypothetical protein